MRFASTALCECRPTRLGASPTLQDCSTHAYAGTPRKPGYPDPKIDGAPRTPQFPSESNHPSENRERAFRSPFAPACPAPVDHYEGRQTLRHRLQTARRATGAEFSLGIFQGESRLAVHSSELGPAG